MEIPTTKQLSQAERFAAGLKLLAEECHMTSLKYSKIGLIYSYQFADGSSIGCGRAHVEAGLVNRNDFDWNDRA